VPYIRHRITSHPITRINELLDNLSFNGVSGAIVGATLATVVAAVAIPMAYFFFRRQRAVESPVQLEDNPFVNRAWVDLDT
jgi:hypothetical protein